MGWTNSVGRDISHHNTITNYSEARRTTDWWQIKVSESDNFTDSAAAQHYRGLEGDPRGAYHFARPSDLAKQVGWFLGRKHNIGPWERPDMLDCEFPGVTSAFIKALVAEYRRQSGNYLVLVYVGFSDLRGSCNPSGWYDEGTPIWAARYRKIGPPASPDTWKTHLGWDHPGLTTYQWDNAAPMSGGNPTDINFERMDLSGGPDMTTSKEVWDELIQVRDKEQKIPARDMMTFTNDAAWKAANAAAETAAHMAALDGTLDANQATLLAAISNRETRVDLTTEQMQLLLGGMSDASKKGLRELLAELGRDQ